MSVLSVIIDVLLAGAKLFGEGAVKEAGKSVVGMSFEKLKEKLKARNAPSVVLLETPGDKAHYRAALEGDLNKPEIIEDAEILQLTNEVREEIVRRKDEIPPSYAIDIDELEAAEGVILERIKGNVKIGTAKTDGIFRATDITGSGSS